MYIIIIFSIKNPNPNSHRFFLNPLYLSHSGLLVKISLDSNFKLLSNLLSLLCILTSDNYGFYDSSFTIGI